MHLDLDIDTGKYSLRAHDLEEFTMIVRRWGLWRDDVEFFIKAAKDSKRMPLFEQPGQGEAKERSV
jgi:hypothetical protein